jgi:hypothetical protein
MSWYSVSQYPGTMLSAVLYSTLRVSGATKALTESGSARPFSAIGIRRGTECLDWLGRARIGVVLLLGEGGHWRTLHRSCHDLF